MKIQVLNSKKEQPLANTRIQIQIRGKDSGYLTCTTDTNGYLHIDDKYKGQQIAFYGLSGASNQWITANNNAILYIDLSKQTALKKENYDTIL